MPQQVASTAGLPLLCTQAHQGLTQQGQGVRQAMLIEGYYADYTVSEGDTVQLLEEDYLYRVTIGKIEGGFIEWSDKKFLGIMSDEEFIKQYLDAHER